MLSKIFNPGNVYDGIELMSFMNDPITISHTNFYSVVWIEHFGSLTINFEEYRLKGYYLIFLCPEEVLVVKDAVKCKVIKIPSSSEIVESDDFIHAFGNIKKCIQQKVMSFLQIGLLFMELQQSIFKNNSPKDHPNKLSKILQLSRVSEEDFNQTRLMFQYHFISLVHKHYKMHHEMAFYSKKLGTTSKRVTEKFHQLGLKPPHAFIKKRILVEAKRQLAFTSKKVKTICFDIGFNDPAYFSRFFKKNTGMTARQFRERYKPT